MTLTLTHAPTLSSPAVVMTSAQLSPTGQPVDRTGTSPATAESAPAVRDVVEEWGIQSFPASDPPSNW